MIIIIKSPAFKRFIRNISDFHKLKISLRRFLMFMSQWLTPMKNSDKLSEIQKMKEIKGVSWRSETHMPRRKDIHTQKCPLKSQLEICLPLGIFVKKACPCQSAHIKKCIHSTNISRCSRIFMMCFQSGLDLPMIYFWLSFISFCFAAHEMDGMAVPQISNIFIL